MKSILIAAFLLITYTGFSQKTIAEIKAVVSTVTDAFPSAGSTNPVSSGGVASQLGTLSGLKTATKSSLVQAINNLYDTTQTVEPINITNLADNATGDSLVTVSGNTLQVKRINVMGDETVQITKTITDQAVTYNVSADFSSMVQKGGVAISSPTSSENVTMFYTPVDITINEIHESIVGTTGPTVTYFVYYGASRDVSDGVVVNHTASATSGSIVTPNTLLIPGGSYVWLVTTAISGTVKDFAITINYHQ